MKKVLLMTVLLLAALMMAAQQPAAKAEKKDDAGPVVKVTEGFMYVYIDYTGPYSKMEKEVQNFITIFMGQGLMPMKPSVVMYYNSPMEVKPEELKWAFGFMVPKDTKVKEPLMIKEVKPQKAVVYIHKGPYTGLGKSHEKVNIFIKEKGIQQLLPTYDRFLNNPMMAKPEDLKTEIVRPIK
jgi:effector-binding domain-containing protein